jgi:hypothetical protein
VYYVDLFYKIFIPMVLGGMSLLVVMDFSRRTINRRRKSLEMNAQEENYPVYAEDGTRVEISESSDINMDVQIAGENEPAEPLAPAKDDSSSGEVENDQ